MPIDLLGQTFGSYKLVELIGRGGMASVYRGYQESIDRSVAIKVLPPEFLHDPSFSQRFISEARTLAKLVHPAILQLYDFGTANDVPYIVMPLMAGGTLNDRIKRGRLPLAEVERLFTPIADALDYAHSLGVVHRDIKPSNILFDARGQPFLADFGIAKAIEASSNLTGTGIVGTPDYMSPEQARGEPMDGRSDIYALGVMAYQSLTGDMLFKATTPIGVMLKHATEPPPPIRQVRPDLTLGIEEVLTKVLAKFPAERYQTASDFMTDFARTAQGVAGRAQPPRPQATAEARAPATHSAPRPTGTVQAPASAAPGSPERRGGFNIGGVLIGGSVGVVLGSVLVVGLIVACCLGIAVLSPAATATPPPTQTPTATPTPAVNLLFADDFSDPVSGWEIGTGSVSDLNYIDGEYSIAAFETGWFVWGNPLNDAYANVSIQANAKYAGGDYADILFGVMCNFQDNTHYYYMGIDTHGFYAIGKRDGDQETLLTGDGDIRYSDLLAQGNSWFRLNADCAGDGTLSLYVDGVFIDSAFDTEYAHGNIGLFVNVFPPAGGDFHQDAVVEVRFDNVSVTELP